MEGQFTEYLINQMEKTIDRDSTDSSADYYRSLLNSERAKMMTKTNGGIGLQKVILDQIYPAHLRNKMNFDIQNRMNNPEFQRNAIKMYQETNSGIEKSDDVAKQTSFQNSSKGEKL